MKYVSTRGGVSNVSFEEALFSGYLPDGGLLVPEKLLESLDETTWQHWSTLSYSDLCKSVLRLYIDHEEIPTDDLNDIVDRAFTSKFPEDVIRIKNLDKELFVLELWHGPTYTFKDLGLSCVAQMMNYFLAKRQKKCIVMILTSGDTGSAAIESIHDSQFVDVIVLYPSNGRISQIQELQMITYPDKNVHVFAADGNSDEFCPVLKRFMQDAEFSKTHQISAMNSLNIVRILVQAVHYIYGYFKVCKRVGETVRFIVPTGGAGNITAGYLVQKMGLPIKTVAAVNACANVMSFFTNGMMDRDKEVIVSASPALDGEMPYNLERILYYESDYDSELVSKLMKEFEVDGIMQIPDDLKAKIQSYILPAQTLDSEVVSAMTECWKLYQYVIDPHTAVAMSVVLKETQSGPRIFKSFNGPSICVATASAVKFLKCWKKQELNLKSQ